MRCRREMRLAQLSTLVSFMEHFRNLMHVSLLCNMRKSRTLQVITFFYLTFQRQSYLHRKGLQVMRLMPLSISRQLCLEILRADPESQPCMREREREGERERAFLHLFLSESVPPFIFSLRIEGSFSALRLFSRRGGAQ